MVTDIKEILEETKTILERAIMVAKERIAALTEEMQEHQAKLDAVDAELSLKAEQEKA